MDSCDISYGHTPYVCLRSFYGTRWTDVLNVIFDELAENFFTKS